jgi:glycosyltransferase involved in cell wall biosynthesis
MLARPGQALRWLREISAGPQESDMQGVPVRYPRWVSPPNRLFGWYGAALRTAQVAGELQRLARAFRPDAIVASWLPDGLTAAWLGRRLGVRVIAIADGTDVNVWPQKHRGWSYARGILNRDVDTLVYVSDKMRQVGQARGLTGKHVVLRNAVDVNLFKPGARAGESAEFALLGIGRLIAQKGYAVLLEALAHFTRCGGGPARLTLVGDGPEKSALLEQAARLGLSDLVAIAPPMRQENLVAYYQNADVFCLPSFSEGFPCVVVEALACGVPVVGSDVGGTAEALDAGSGLLVPAGDAAALGEALLQARARAWDRAAIRARAVREFSFEQWAETMMGLARGEAGQTA